VSAAGRRHDIATQRRPNCARCGKRTGENEARWQPGTGVLCKKCRKDDDRNQPRTP
jgi:hypothetical protein